MFSSVASDILRCRDWNVHGLAQTDSQFQPDPRITFHPISTGANVFDRIREISQLTDFVIIIAPESDMTLQQCVLHVAEREKKLLSPDVRFVQIATDKWETYQLLRSQDIPTIASQVIPLDEIDDRIFPFPLVVKPVDGCGSQNVHFICDNSSRSDFQSKTDADKNGSWLVQPFIAGKSISVSILDGQQRHILPATEQIFDAQPIGNYVENRDTLSENEQMRAAQLAQNVLDAVQPTMGYWGIDMILGPCTAGTNDVVVEINPRFTSSYSTLRTIVEFNLAEQMLDNAVSKM